MSENVKKSLRTQGKYSAGPNNRDKHQKESHVDKELPGTISHSRKRNSNGQKEENSSFTGVAEDKSPITNKRNSTHSPIRYPEDSPDSSSVKYQENTTHSFNELEVQKITEIRTSGIHTLSQTDNGPSTIFYEPNFIDAEEASELFHKLQDTTCWNDKNIVIRGVEYPQPRLVAWYGPLPYTYSGVTLEPAEMPKAVCYIKNRIEEYLKLQNLNISFNSVLLNCYRDGKDSVAWHSDDELLMSVCPTIGSISFGETRRFEMRRKIKSYEEQVSNNEVEKCFIKLTHGSLLVMSGFTQLDWQHRIPKEYHDKEMRINLTFRTVYPIDRSPIIMSKDGKKQSEKLSNQDAPTNNKMNFNEDEFPPLSSTLKTINLDTEKHKEIISPISNLNLRNNNTKESIEYVVSDTVEYEDIISSNSNLFSKNNGTNKKIECVSDELLNHPHMSNTELVNNLKDTRQKTEYDYDISKKNINLGDNFTHDSDISNAGNSIEDQSFNSSMHASSEHTYIEPPISVESTNNAQETLSYAVHNPVSNLKSNSILNVEAQEFVPILPPITTYEEFSYDTMDIKKLLEYNVKDINDDELHDYSNALRKKHMECDLEFEFFIEDSLNFLNNLMEEAQSLRTQRLITERMHKLLCEFFDELDYSGNSSKLHGSHSGQVQYNQRENYNFHREEGNFRNTGSNRGEIYNRNKRQNNRREQPVSRKYSNKGQIFSNQDFSQVGKRSCNRGNYSSREIQRNKNSNREDNFGRESFSSTGNRNFSREGNLSHEKFSRVEKRNSNRGDYSNQEKFSGKENKSSVREDYSQGDFSDRRKRDSNEKDISGDDISDWGKSDSNIEKDYSQEDFSDLGKSDSNVEKECSREDFTDSSKIDSTGEKYYNQEEISSRDDKIHPVIDRNFNGARINSRREFSSGRRKNSGRGAFYNRRGGNAREEFSNWRRKDTSRGGEYSSQDEFPNRRENLASQEEISTVGPRFSNRGEKNFSRGYRKNRKEFLTREKEVVDQP